MIFKKIVSSTVSISSEAARKTVEALTLLHHPSLSQALKAFTSLSQLKQVHTHPVISGLTPNLFTTTGLLACAALSPSAHNLSLAAAIFQRFPNPSTFMYNTMLRAFSHHPDRCYVCFEYYKRLLCNGLVPR